TAPTTTVPPTNTPTTTAPATTRPPASAPTTSGAPTTGAQGHAATGTRYAAPVDANARPLGSITVSATVRGSCSTGSDVIGNVSVYRCFAGNGVYDPCWAFVSPGSASPPGVLCLPAPWSESAVKILAPHIAGGISVTGIDRSAPWGVELTTHQQCLAVQGAHSDFHGRFIDFTCSEGATTGPALELLRGADQGGPTWTYRSVERTGTVVRPGPVVSVQTAWFAGPPLVRTTAQCQSSHLAVSAGTLRTGQGHVGLTLLFRNTSPAACSLFGYPGVAALDVAGHQVQQAKRAPRGDLGGIRSDERTPSAVVLGPGQTASALLEGTERSGAGNACAAFPALLVTPPNTSTSVRLTQPFPSCSTPSIHPVVIGVTGADS
ncbi:MAG: DUF4232 domain-containing protein, partial [Acidimicrobiaceae bacterium]|nr:DUF4232 domain-containing protein [Acidimicrobiaceae bacterium]